MEKALFNSLKTSFASVTNEVTALFKKYDATLKLDAIDSEFYRELQELETKYTKEFYDDKMFNVLAMLYASKYFQSLFNFNAQEMNRFLQNYIKGEMPIGSEMVEQYLRPFVNELKEKTKSYTLLYFVRIRNLLAKYNNNIISLGKFLKSISILSQQIAKTVPAGIARDTIGTFNSTILQRLFTAFGFSMYLWNTVGDERVRGNPSGLYPKSDPSHYIMNGLLCRWDNDLVYSEDNGTIWKSRFGKMEKEAPGRAYGCRCVGIPYMVQILNSINRQVGE